jgi:PAS domain S-box-containing protein
MMRAALQRSEAREETLAVLIDAKVPQAVATARLVHRLVPSASILFVADHEESEIRRQLGVVPLLGSNWAFVPADESRLRRVLSDAQRAMTQRRSVQTTIRRVGQQLAAPRSRVETRFRREMLAEHHLRTVMTHGFDAVICFGDEQQVLAWNGAAEAILRIPEQAVAGRTIDQLVREPALQDVLKLVRDVYETNTMLRREICHQRQDGASLDLEVSVTPVRDETGATAGVVLIGRDMTERRRAEREALAARDEAERANRAKDRFLAVLSHELRTPLTPVLAILDSLSSRGGLPMSLRSDIELIRRNVLLESHLINDLLDISRISKGKLQLRVELLDIHHTLEHAQDICRPDAVAKSIRIHSDFAATNSRVCGDLARIQQVFWNLIQNAVKFTPAGGMVTVRTSNPTADRIELSVHDTGVGIPPEVLPKIFDPFEQGTKAVTRQFGGLGLGLAICKALVEAHGGSIAASSAGKGHGATFAVLLKTATEEECTAIPNAPSAAGVEKRSFRILLVEDHDDTRGTLQRLLIRRGHNVRTASTVAEALQMGSQCNFDILLTDIGLPDASGHDLMREIRGHCPTIRGIALSGFGMEEDIATSMGAGFSEHLTKPVNFQKLEEAIYRHATE